MCRPQVQKCINGPSKALLDQVFFFFFFFLTEIHSIGHNKQSQRMLRMAQIMLGKVPLLHNGLFGSAAFMYRHNVGLCAMSYCTQSMPVDIFWYYMVELAFYVSLTVSQFLDIKRKVRLPGITCFVGRGRGWGGGGGGGVFLFWRCVRGGHGGDLPLFARKTYECMQ